MPRPARPFPVHQLAPLPDLPEIPTLGASDATLQAFVASCDTFVAGLPADFDTASLTAADTDRLERLADARDAAAGQLSAIAASAGRPAPGPRAQDVLDRIRATRGLAASSGAGLPPLPAQPRASSSPSAAAGRERFVEPTRGQEIGGILEVADRFATAIDEIKTQMRTGSEILDGRLTLASMRSTIPAGRHLTKEPRADWAAIEAVTGPQALAASGGLCAPLEPYYDVLEIAGAQRPVRGALPTFGVERGGIQLIPPPTLSSVGPQARTVADAATTNAANTVTSNTARFVSYDIGATITGSGIPASTVIIGVSADQKTATISNNATATASGVSITITDPGATGYITAAQDALGLTGTAGQVASSLKPCLHITCAASVSFTVSAITRCIEVGNFSARTYPEQVTAWLELAMSYQARLAETQLLNQLSANSTQITQAQALGTARDIVPTVIKAAAYYRQHNRMPAEAMLRWLGPAWLIDAMVADVMRGSGYESDFLFGQLRDELVTALRQANVEVAFYEDSGTGKGQYFNSGNAQGAGALTTFPGTAVHYLFAEGSFLFLDGGTLDLGIVRDSTLNAQNNYRIFAETFEAAAFVGVESLEITSSIAVNGAASAAITPPAGL
ncbi:MAG: major capsid protein [Acidimicrobiales bacterium]|nr:major capsid protein [Acidimicrobiales bacterium]